MANQDLRQLLLAVQVLHDVDLDVRDGGAVLTAGVPVPVRWTSVLAAVGGARLGSDTARLRVARWLQLRRWVADTPLDLLAAQARPVGLPAGHVNHPGPGWALDVVHGGALTLGVGTLGLDPADSDAVVVVPPSVWRAARLTPAQWWPACRDRLEAMGALAATRWQGDPQGLLRPMGDCDVVTLLGSAALRSALADSDGGMRAVVVPMLRRGWTQLSRLDSAFGPAAAAATPAADRGFARPLLVTADEVVMVPPGGLARVVDLTDPVTERWDLAVRYR